MKTNPLNHIKIASPCQANWDEMYGDNCKRFCSQCKLNVYNLSEMTQQQAEIFLFEAEGRVCVRLYRRTDGTVITQDCPVGWQAVKQRVSRFATATFGLIIGFFSGLWAFNQVANAYEDSFNKTVIENQETISTEEDFEVLLEPQKMTHKKYEMSMGRPDLSNLQNKIEETSDSKEKIEIIFSGGVSNMSDLKMWIFTERFPK